VPDIALDMEIGRYHGHELAKDDVKEYSGLENSVLPRMLDVGQRPREAPEQRVTNFSNKPRSDTKNKELSGRVTSLKKGTPCLWPPEVDYKERQSDRGPSHPQREKLSHTLPW